jgi:transketolase
VTHAPEVLRHKAASLRRTVLETALAAGKGHVPPAFSWVEIGVTLFHGGVLRVRPEEPDWPGRDRFILSKGHGCLTLYALLADLGFFPAAELATFAADASRLAGHPDPLLPGVEVVSGSLGHGLGLAAGLALGARHDGADWIVATVLGDGECHEGSVWEAAAFIGHHRLANVLAIVDRNRFGATAATEESCALEPLADRWCALGWEVRTVDGHDVTALLAACDGVRAGRNDRPRVVIAETTKGKGVSFMEASAAWHHRMPKGAEIAAARAELARGFEVAP